MNVKIRLDDQNPHFYNVDTTTITDRIISARASNIKTLEIDISSTWTTEILTVKISTDKLWFLGFQNNNGDWIHFSGLSQGGTQLTANGSYMSLGASHGIKLTKNGVMTVTNLKHKETDSKLTSGQSNQLIHLIVIVSEALRFYTVLFSICNLLRSENPDEEYNAPWIFIHNWSQMSDTTHVDHSEIRTRIA